MSHSKVIASKTTYDEAYRTLNSALELTGSRIEKSENLSIKINLCDARTPDTGAITHPLLLDRLLRCLRETYGYSMKVNVVESEATVAFPDLFMKWFGFKPVLEKWKAKYVNLSREQVTWKEINDGYSLRRIPVPRTIENSDYLISLAKLKTNSLTKITCSLKNQFGLLPIRNKDRFHPAIDNVITDLNRVMRPDLSIVDGIIAHVGSKGPAFGKPIPARILVVGNDPVAVDSYCASVMGFNQGSIGHINKAAEAGIGIKRDYALTIRGFDRKPRIDSQFSTTEQYLFRFANIMLRRSRSRFRRG